ncbi:MULTISPECIES: hypothetical protein [Bacillati]|uniref:Uncharacterized protein n=1 Tax=Niallia taxi TaxID=2499688 RepID=A0A3S2X5H1_9BACI|nr:hypothetical protein [Niallia taxi]RVT57400.1 hypothetical protein EM808_24555 [Niallia taxi]
MAEYQSKYPELGFYVNGERKQFAFGAYKTEEKDEIAVLDVLTDVNRVDKPKAAPRKAAADKK